MPPTWTTADVIARLPEPSVPRLPAPAYTGTWKGLKVMLAVESMTRHMTDEGNQLQLGLWRNGFALEGWRYGLNLTDVKRVLSDYEPGMVVVQDKREWDGKTAGKGFDERERFTNVGALRGRDDVFKLTVLKDAQNNPQYHSDSAAEMGVHGWVTYYPPRVVAHVAPFVRPDHLVRTHHSVDPAVVPAYSAEGRSGAVISGAVSGAYPLRQRLIESAWQLPGTTVLRHPGYGRNGCATPAYLRTLTGFKVAICTASRYGYALRKIVEATAAGCAVITDLPEDDVMPEIDGNLYRVHNDASVTWVAELVRFLDRNYDPVSQREFAERAVRHYSYLETGRRLAADIERLRTTYN